MKKKITKLLALMNLILTLGGKYMYFFICENTLTRLEMLLESKNFPSRPLCFPLCLLRKKIP
ncbi:hypothetical protein NL476_27945, partial [Klebsiella pneumoniae]|nr:hypothetical protein [Klebsiella pneumoniae]